MGDGFTSKCTMHGVFILFILILHTYEILILIYTYFAPILILKNEMEFRFVGSIKSCGIKHVEEAIKDAEFFIIDVKVWHSRNSNRSHFTQVPPHGAKPKHMQDLVKI